VRRADAALVNRRLAVIDDRLDEIHGIHAELKEVGAATVAGAKAEIVKTQSDLAHRAAQGIAASAAQQLKMMTRTSWLRALSAAGAVGFVTFVTGGVLGFAWGSGSAARTVETANTVVHYVATAEGPAAVHDWSTLMRYNPITLLMARCTGRNLAVEGGRKGCHMWLWIERPPLSQLKKG
jgi:hypothetical protein